MPHYSYKRKYAAHILGGYGYVYLPDEVADNQKEWDGKQFPVLCSDGATMQVKLRADIYEFLGSVTVDAIVLWPYASV